MRSCNPIFAACCVITFVAAVGACKSSEATASGPSGDVSTAGPVETCEAIEGAAPVALTTSDGLTLEADFYPSGTEGGPGVVLLHMIPPSNDKSNFPPEFIASLHAAGLTVLNVNRRGAGNSEGDPKDAYEGDKGRLDASAAHDFLTSSACHVPANAIGFVGASNGTTTTLDFTVAAEAGDRPAAIVFLSPGSYTENQNKVSDHAHLLNMIPIFIGYPDSESEWPESIRPLGGGGWILQQYDGGKHGTGLFTTHPDSITTVTNFLRASITGA